MRTPTLAIALLFAGTASIAAATPASTWRQFRDRHANHIQTLAVSAPDADGTRTLIIAEPPPSATLPDLQNRYRSILRDITVRQHRIGFDGWVRDVTGTLVPMRDDELRSTIQNLSRDLFGTSYKSYALDLENDRPATGDSYDLNVTASELREWIGLDRTESVSTEGYASAGSSMPSAMLFAWAISAVAVALFFRYKRWRYLLVSVSSLSIGFLIGPSASTSSEPVTAGSFPPAASQLFQSLHGGEPSTMRGLFAQQRRGVFVSSEPGLMALIVSRSSPLNESTVALREFALESDLIVGAIGDSSSLVVLGRERQVPVELLPPLRVETIIQLAAATTGELAQSYERTRFLAGKFDGLRDWAPILLSDELQDTEYGSLLNVTDQLLKSWSQHGEIEYINFRYPKPAEYPFPKPLDAFAQARMITFNWNTKGVGYNDDRNGFDVLAFTRTGALPVDYLGESDARLLEAEDQGYNYFAGRNDPNLVRVVQYAGLYQIFRKFGVSGSYAWSSRARGGDKALAPLVERGVRIAYDLDLDKVIDLLGITADDEEAWREVEKFRDLQGALDEFVDDFGVDALHDIVDSLIHPRAVRDLDSLDRRHSEAFVLARSIEASSLLGEFVDSLIPQAKKAYSEAEGREDPTSWIKTPSIVISWSTGKDAKTATGGHNLYSRVSHFTIDRSLPAGKVRVARLGDDVTVFYSAEDAPKIGSSVRAVSRRQGATVAELEATVENTLREATIESRSMAAALKLGATHNPPSTPTALQGVRRLGGTATWKNAGGVSQAHSTMLAQLKEADFVPIVVERRQGQYFISRAGTTAQIEAPDAASALDAVTSSAETGQATHLHFVGMEAEQARSFAQAVEIHSGGPGKARLRTSVEGPGGRGPIVVGELRKGRWDFRNAEITTSESVVGTAQKAIDIAIEVPNTLGGRLKLGVRVVFDRITDISAETLARVRRVVQEWLLAVDALKERLDLVLATKQLMRDLEKIDPRLGHGETRITIEAGEVIVVQNELPGEDAVAGE